MSGGAGGYLYKLFDDKDRLIYVGSTTNWLRRFNEHKRKSVWVGRVRRHEITEYESIELARAAERIVVSSYRPRYNRHRFKANGDWNGDVVYKP